MRSVSLGSVSCERGGVVVRESSVYLGVALVVGVCATIAVAGGLDGWVCAFVGFVAGECFGFWASLTTKGRVSC